MQFFGSTKPPHSSGNRCSFAGVKQPELDHLPSSSSAVETGWELNLCSLSVCSWHVGSTGLYLTALVSLRILLMFAEGMYLHLCAETLLSNELKRQSLATMERNWVDLEYKEPRGRGNCMCTCCTVRIDNVRVLQTYCSWLSIGNQAHGLELIITERSEQPSLLNSLQDRIRQDWNFISFERA